MRKKFLQVKVFQQMRNGWAVKVAHKEVVFGRRAWLWVVNSATIRD